MRSVKFFVTTVFALLIFLCFITIFLPSSVTVSKTVLINAHTKNITAQIKNFHNWKNWHPFFQNKNIDVSITQNADTSFAILTNEDQKKIIFILLKSSENNISVVLNEGDKKNESYQFILLSNGEGQTQLTWNINSSLGWLPWKKFSGVMMDKVKGEQYQEALLHLKAASEKNN